MFVTENLSVGKQIINYEYKGKLSLPLQIA